MARKSPYLLSLLARTDSNQPLASKTMTTTPSSPSTPSTSRLPTPPSRSSSSQYPNRVRGRPYNLRNGAKPDDVRIKPSTGFIEVDVGLNTTFNFNKFKGLQWGDALSTSRDVHNSTGTYGPAAGFSNAKPRAAGGRGNTLKDAVARESQISNDLLAFYEAETENKVLRTQTLGGQVLRHDSAEEAGKPIYFVGAFRKDELHLTQLSGAAQMRPQFHHLDAEEQRSRLAAARETQQASGGDGVQRPQGEARSVLSREKKPDDTRDRFRRPHAPHVAGSGGGELDAGGVRGRGLAGGVR